MICSRILLVILICATPAMTGCQSPQARAAEELSEQLEQRRRARKQSVAIYEKAMRLYREAKYDEASKLLRDAVQADSQNAAAWLALGVAEDEQNRYFEAAQSFSKAAELVPSSYEPHFNLGILYESVGYYDRAIASYETALSLAPDDLHVIENLARAYVRADRDLRKAKRLVDRALEREFRPRWRQWLQLQSLRLEQRLQDDAMAGGSSP